MNIPTGPFRETCWIRPRPLPCFPRDQSRIYCRWPGRRRGDQPPHQGGWSAPAFFNLAGGSVGLQIGASKTDFVLLFMNDEALGGLLKDKLEIGGEGSVAAGPVGRSASATTERTAESGNHFLFAQQGSVCRT